jgi:hypothetical protein
MERQGSFSQAEYAGKKNTHPTRTVGYPASDNHLRLKGSHSGRASRYTRMGRSRACLLSRSM